jgi:hypothetical protein
MKAEDNTEKTVEKLSFTASSDLHDRILSDLLDAQEQSKKSKSAIAKPSIRRKIMKNPITKLAAAAVIIVAVWIGLSIIGIGPGGGVALAEVLDTIEKVRAFTYQMKMNIANVPGMPAERPLDLEVEIVAAKGIGMRLTAEASNRFVSETCVVLDERAIITLRPGQKKYTRIRLTDEILDKMQRENGDPRVIVRQFTENEYTKLGRSIVDGVEVEGFESNDPNIFDKILGNVVGRLWINPDTKLPVRIDIESVGENGEKLMVMNVYDFKWDVEVEPDFFRPTIPDDYSLAAEEVELSSDEESVIELLRLFSELTGGKYPSELNMVKIMKELQTAMIADFSDPTVEAAKQAKIQKLMSLQMAGAFYSTILSKGKDPAYHGAIVTAEFPHAVLMRWKIDKGTYRIIFGDLIVGEVSAADLEALESAPLNLKPLAIKPNPANGTKGTALTGLKLTWMPGANATCHRVYFGTDPGQLTLLGETTIESAEPATLQQGTNYYWRIDEVQADGSVATGDVWSFNTGRLVAHWKLDDGTGSTAVDSAGSGYESRLVGDPTWTTGIIGGALEFDGDGDYIEIIDSNDLHIENQITVSAWIKTDTIDKRWQAVVTKGDRSWRLQGQRRGYALEFACTGLIIPGSSWGSLYGKTDVNDGKWHHVAGVYDGKRIYLYLDGKVDNSKPASGQIRFDDKPILIGDNALHRGRFWNGIIDDVRIYSYGLSIEEIRAICRQ